MTSPPVPGAVSRTSPFVGRAGTVAEVIEMLESPKVAGALATNVCTVVPDVTWIVSPVTTLPFSAFAATLMLVTPLPVGLLEVVA